tara:strand:- start:1016 stop:1330 length:315 start_codon:yes stop_codon:yes gene_type:complete
MTIHICPRCQKRYAAQSETVDYIHECDSGNATLDQEDVFVIGNWEDYTGSADVTPSVMYVQGAANEVQGTRAGINGIEVFPRTKRGKNAEVYRSRQNLQYIKLK